MTVEDAVKIHPTQKSGRRREMNETGWITDEFTRVRWLTHGTPSATWGLVVLAAFLVAETAAVAVLTQLDPAERLGAVYVPGVLVVATFWSLPMALGAAVLSAVAFDWVRGFDSSGQLFHIEAAHLVSHLGLVLVAVTAYLLARLARARAGALQASYDELQASRTRIVTAADAARRRLERDLHDGAQQRLESVKLDARLAAEMAAVDDDGLADQLARIVAGLSEVSEDLREFSRGIHPAVLAGGLAPALRTLARRSTVPVDLTSDIAGTLPAPVELAAYYVVAESLTNAAKHARAEAVAVRAETRDGWLRLRVTDDGAGGADARGGSGLVGLADRVAALGGRLRVTSPRGDGTTVAAELPLTQWANSG